MPERRYDHWTQVLGAEEDHEIDFSPWTTVPSNVVQSATATAINAANDADASAQIVPTPPTSDDESVTIRVESGLARHARYHIDVLATLTSGEKADWRITLDVV